MDCRASQTCKRAPELLAPAGNLRALAGVIEAGADSVYVAGKRFGMRQHAAWLNFTERQLIDAVRFAHDAGKRIYVVLNNLMTPREIEILSRFLDFLAGLGPDAVIVQDLGVVKLIRDKELDIPLHASSMMNVHDSATASVLADLGVTRIIASRDITLAEAVLLQERSGMEFEIFVHGDMCIAHSGQCLTSGILTGESSSRGKCLKPCRWSYTLIDQDADTPLPNPCEGSYLLARKDLGLFENIPALVQSGIAALKIEGRARKPEYLRFLVESYRTALDRYVADPVGYAPEPRELERMQARRIRNLCSGLTFGDAGSESIDYSGQREPRFFSICAEQKPFADSEFASAPAREHRPSRKPALSVRCADWEEARSAARAGADRVILDASCYTGRRGPERAREFIRDFADDGIELGAAMERVVYDCEREELVRLAGDCVAAGVRHFLVSSLGMGAALAREFGGSTAGAVELHADAALNVLNPSAVSQLADLGYAGVTAWLEATLGQVEELARRSVLPIECVIHGPLEGMCSEHCVIRAALGPHRPRGSCRDLCDRRRYALRDLLGQDHRIVVDAHCRNHILLPRDLCALHLVPTLCAAGVASLRIEARRETPALIDVVTRSYRRAVDAAMSARRIDWLRDPLWAELVVRSPRGLSPGAYANPSQDVSLPLAELPTNEIILHTLASAECLSPVS